MGTEITVSQAIALRKKPTGFYALSTQQQQEHQRKIGLRARTVLSQFWFDSDATDAEQILELEGWVDVLSELSEMEFRKAWAEYQRSGPRTKAGKLYKPDAGALYRIAIASRPKVTVVPDPAPEKPNVKPVTKEKAAEIIEEFGINLKRFVGNV